MLLEDGSILLRKDGNWSTLLSGGAPPLTDLILVDDQHGFAVSRQALWKWDGLRWREATAAPVGFLCQKLLAFAEGDQFNALVLGRDSVNGKARIWQAVSPTLAPAATTPNPIESTLPSEEITESVGLCGTSQSDLYLLARQMGEAGERATSKIYHFDGRTWTRVSELGSLPTASAIGGSGRDDVWIPLVDGRLARRQTVFPSSGPRVTIKLIESPIVLGATATFSSEVTGTGPFSYQWQQGTSDLIGAIHSELLIYPVSQNSVGTYRVKVTSASGTADAHVDLSQVKSPPTVLRQPQAISAYAGSAAEFVIEVIGEGPLVYQWFSSTGPVKAENKPVLSVEGLRSLDAGPYWAEVSNLYGKVASDRALLSVLPGLHLSAASILTPHQFTGAADRPFVIEKSSDLLEWTPWFTNQVLRFAAPFEVLDADAVSSPYRFYRVREW